MQQTVPFKRGIDRTNRSGRCEKKKAEERNRYLHNKYYSEALVVDDEDSADLASMFRAIIKENITKEMECKWEQ